MIHCCRGLFLQSFGYFWEKIFNATPVIFKEILVEFQCSIVNYCPYFSGRWRKRKREGPGLICGPSLEAMGLKEIWGKYKGGLLNGPGKATLLGGDCTLQGNFVNGKLHGPVRGTNSKGMKIYVISKRLFSAH